jgi:hypothetical protein
MMNILRISTAAQKLTLAQKQAMTVSGTLVAGLRNPACIME